MEPTLYTPQPLPDVTMGDLAPHIAADLYRQLGDRPVIVIVQAPRKDRRPTSDYGIIGLAGLCGAAGIVGLVAFMLSVLSLAAAVVPTLGGISVSVSLVKRRKGAKSLK